MQRKIVFTALGAFGFGALASWAVTADIYEKRLKELKTPIVNVYNRYNDLNEPVVDIEYVDPNQTELIVDQRNLIDPYEEPDQEEVPEGETPEETRSNLQKLIDAYTANPDVPDEFANKAIQDSDNAPPFVISKAAYAWDEEGENFEKITLTYFPRDRVLLDDDEDPIEDIARMVGWRSLSQFGGESEDPDVVFIRNRRLRTDFEVVKEEETQLPLHVTYGMEKEEFRANKAAGLIKLRQEDDDY